MSEDTPWLSDAQLYQWMHLVGALTNLPSVLEQQLKQDSGLNFFEYSVLAGLSNAPDRAMKMAELAGYAHGSQSRLSHAVTRLERAGWVQRRTCTEGSRAVEAVLTDAGHAKIVEAAPGHVREARRLVVDVLTAEEFGQLQLALRKILQVADPGILRVLDDSYVRYLTTSSPDVDACLEACTQACTETVAETPNAGGTSPTSPTSRNDAGQATPG